ncbi:glycosyltransferase [Escherichia coli]|uniref:glycosyltransferase n=1 Tax=Escherichia coli TaxID=562 RepID=UPI002020680A|nr:glycosyltransferase [Escherichia coli]
MLCHGTVCVVGKMRDLILQLSKSSIYSTKPFPRSTQEAMAMGRAVITSDVPGCRDTVVDGVNGFLIKPRSSHALAEKMLCFLHQPELITQMGNASHQIALQQFDSSIVNSKLMKILRVDFENTKSNVC